MKRKYKIFYILFSFLFFSCKWGSLGEHLGPTFAYIEILDEDHNILEDVEFSAVSGGKNLKDFYIEINKYNETDVVYEPEFEYGTYLYELCSESYVYSYKKDGVYIANPDIEVTATKSGYKTLVFSPYEKGKSIFRKSYIMEKE